MATFPTKQPPRLLTRSRSDRWLGGVCAAIARSRGIDPGWIRAAFVAGGLFGGVGVLVYLAGWLIIPQEGERPDDASSRWLVSAARACCGVLGLITLAVLAAGATLFGFGWAAAGLAAAALVAVLVVWPRLSPAWALLPVAAIALPSAAVAAGGLELTDQVGHTTIVPRVLAPGGRATFRAGLGTLLVDLRGSSLPATGTLNVRVVGGVRRTIVALPHDRCVHVELRYGVRSFWARVASQLAGRSPAQGIVLFGKHLPGNSGARAVTSTTPGPTLKLDFISAGGSLYVRDYPPSVDPELTPDWPGYRVYPEPRPDVRSVRKRVAQFELRSWRARHAVEARSQALIDQLMPGPCVTATGNLGAQP